MYTGIVEFDVLREWARPEYYINKAEWCEANFLWVVNHPETAEEEETDIYINF